MVSGFTTDGVSYLNERLKPFGLTSYAVPAGNADLDQVKLEPGSSVGVSLVRGGYGDRRHRHGNLDRR